MEQKERAMKPSEKRKKLHVESDKGCGMYYIQENDIIFGETFSKEFADEFVDWYNNVKLKENTSNESN
jgi:hypothetical protein